MHTYGYLQKWITWTPRHSKRGSRAVTQPRQAATKAVSERTMTLGTISFATDLAGYQSVLHATSFTTVDVHESGLNIFLFAIAQATNHTTSTYERRTLIHWRYAHRKARVLRRTTKRRPSRLHERRTDTRFVGDKHTER